MKCSRLITSTCLTLALLAPAATHAADLDMPASSLFYLEAEGAAGITFIDRRELGGSARTNGDIRHGTFEGDLRMLLPLDNGFALQMDVGGIFTTCDDCNGPGPGQAVNDYFYSGAHAIYRDPSQYAFGIFGMVGTAFGGEDGPLPKARGQAWLIGGEVQYYWDDLTLYGQAGYFNGHETSGDVRQDVMDDAWFVRGQGSWFDYDGKSRWRLEATYAKGRETRDGNKICNASICLDLQAFTWEARYDRKLTDTIGFFSLYHGTRLEQTGPASAGQCCQAVTDHTILAGVQVHIGANDLLTMSRQGVGFSMPKIGRWLAYSTETVDTAN